MLLINTNRNAVVHTFLQTHVQLPWGHWRSIAPQSNDSINFFQVNTDPNVRNSVEPEVPQGHQNSVNSDPTSLINFVDSSLFT
jgi:hypothetical protein